MSGAAPVPAAQVALERLRGFARGDGGYPERPGGDFRPDATALAVLALAAAGAGDEAGRAGGRLAGAQRADGSVPVDPRRGDAVWPTALALLAWTALPPFGGQASRAATRFLLATSGRHWVRTPADRAGNDPALRGWSWTAGAHSWAEPTALAVLALGAAGAGGHPRVAEAVRMLLDRQLPGGGWNYGNTAVYGQGLEPHPDVTGIVLAALAGRVAAEAVAASLELLAARLPGMRAPRSLAWGILGLATWGRRPADADSWAAASLAADDGLPGYGVSHLALLALAALRPEGLAA